MVYGAISRILFPVTAIALVGAAMWGYQEYNEKNSILIKAENQYQRAFHELNHHIDKLQDELGKSLVINSRKQMTPCLTNVWRLAYAAQSDVGQLPLTLMPFNNTEEFLAKVANFAYGVAVRDLDRQPLTQKEQQTLKALYAHSKSIQQQLQQVQTRVLDQHLRWMDVEMALASDDKNTDNSIIDGFRTVDRAVQEFPEIDWGTTIQSREKKREMRIKGLDGRPISREEAAEIARRFVGVSGGDVQAEVDDNGRATDYSAYSVTLTGKRFANPVQLDVTKRAGKVVWLLNERDVNEEKLTLDQAEESARKFLAAHGYPGMVAVESDSYEGLAVFTFVPERNGVRYYPDGVTVKVALDNGDVTGFHAEDYLFNHKDRPSLRPALSADRARGMINPQVKITGQRLAVIEGKDTQEVLCYEFTGQHDNDTYLIYINAQTGDEEEIVKMDVETEEPENR